MILGANNTVMYASATSVVPSLCVCRIFCYDIRVGAVLTGLGGNIT